MICSILLLITLTSHVSGSFVVNVAQSSYQAEENHNVTLEWTFRTRTGRSLNSISFLCEMLTDVTSFVLFHLHEGVEVSESQDERFAGRVQFDKDVLREGRLRLHVSRLRTDDSGVYLCDVLTGYSTGSKECNLNVSAARHRTTPETPDTTSGGGDPPQRGSPSEPERWGWIVLYCVLGLLVVLTLLGGCWCFYNRLCIEPFLNNEGSLNDSSPSTQDPQDSLDTEIVYIKMIQTSERKCVAY